MYEYGGGRSLLPWRNNEHRDLPYVNEPFNNPEDLARWKALGFTHERYTGDMYDMRQPRLPWMDFSLYQSILDWEHLSWSFYKMKTGTILPEHVDTFKRFKDLYPNNDPDTIHRAIVFLEDWEPGHVLTIGTEQAREWKAGDFVWWKHDVPHLAANLGTEDRYTLQLTGFKRERIQS